QLVPLLAEQFQYVFKELHTQKDFVQKVDLEEEIGFLKTLQQGIEYFQFNVLATINWNELNRQDGIYYKENGEEFIVNGEIAFKLQDTYDFPIDLSELLAKEQGLRVDMQGFEAELQKQKARSRAATAVDTEDWITVNEGAETE